MREPVVISPPVCYHCGNELELQLNFDDKKFCCQGCVSAYGVLKSQGMTDYYLYRQGQGNQANPKSDTLFDYLEDESTKATLLEFKSADLEHIRLYVSQIHCTACVWLLERLGSLDAGILRSEVDFLRKELFVAYRPSQISLKKLVVLLSTLGYEPTITLEDTQKENQTEKTDYSNWYKMGVAGFCFGNIMLLSFPEYLGIDIKEEPRFTFFFGLLNIALSLPVLFYGARDYFVNAWASLKQHQITLDVPLSLGILALFGESVYEILSKTGAGYLDSLAGLIFFLLLGKVFQTVSHKRLRFDRDYSSYFPVSCTVLNENGEEKQVTVKKLKLGDKILVRNNELVPCDAMLTCGKAFIDFSFVTGESLPVEHQLGEMVYAGGRQSGEAIELEVIRPIAQSYFTKLWNSDVFNKDKHDSFQTMVNKRSKYFTFAVLAVAILSSAFWWWAVGIAMAAKVFATVLIITCPCALALSAPFTLGNVMRVLSANGFFVKNSTTIEKLAQVDTVVFDKTGTLTMAGQEVVSFEGKNLNQDELFAIATILQNSNHPMSRAVIKSLGKFEKVEIEHFEEFSGKGVKASHAGVQWKIGSAEWTNADNSWNQKGSSVFVAKNNEVLGFFKLQNVYREKLSGVFAALKSLHINAKVLSGDSDHEKMVLKELLGENVEMMFKQDPESKLEHIKTLSANNQKVMMLGDGLNDAGALKAAFVGVAVSNDSLQFTPSSDAIIDGISINKLDRLMLFCKKSMSLIKISFAISLAYNLVGISFAVQGMLTPLVAAIMMPLSSVTVVAFATLSSRYVAKNLKLYDDVYPVSADRG